MLVGCGGDGIVGWLCVLIGLDDLDLMIDDQGNVLVWVGKYLFQNFYIDVEVGGEGIIKLNLNFDVFRSLIVCGFVVSDGESMLGLFYEWDY